MLLQLTLIGYVLIYIFQTESGLVISGVLAVMLVAASWIALNTVDLPKGSLFPASLVSVLLGGGTTLLLVTQGVLQLKPWYQPSYIIPLAGMIFSASMTNISLALERLINSIFVDANVYLISHLQTQVDWAEVLLVCVAALIISFLATLYPAYRASKIQPAEVLRYE